MPPARAALLVAGLSSVVACEKPATLEHRELPGFSIDLPVGEQLQGYTNLEYADGTIAVKDPDHQRVALLHWTAGTKLSDAELAAMTDTFLAALKFTGARGTTKISDPTLGSGVSTTKLDGEPFPFYLSQVECGGRTLTIATGAAHGGDTMWRDVARSLVCKPDPAAERQLGQVTLAIQLALPGWHMASQDEGQVMLESDTQSIAMIQSMGTLRPEHFLKAIGPILRSAYKGTIVAGQPEGELVPLSGSVDGQPAFGVARLVQCPKKSTLVLQLSPSRTLADEARPAVAAARCLNPGEAPPTWPPSPSAPADGAK